MWPRPIHPDLRLAHDFRRQLQMQRSQIKSVHSYQQLLSLDTQTLMLLTELELAIVVRHERLVGGRIDDITQGRHRDGLRILSSTLHQPPLPWSKVAAFCPVGHLPTITSILDL